MAGQHQDVPPVRDRRRFPRYRVKDGALAFIGTVPGAIVDISEGGMAVHYAVFGREPNRNLRLDIFLGSDDFLLKDIPASIVNDTTLDPDAPFRAVQVKRFSLRFGELTDQQKSSLRYFILHNTVSEA
ncbi:PilZ domain-containing protein [Desulfolithobacter sp.]